MKKISKTVGMITFAVIVGALSAFAWIELTDEITYSGLSVRLADTEDSVITISSTKTGSGTDEVHADSVMDEMIPCTSDDGKTFKDESGVKVHGEPYYLEKTFYIHANEAGHTISIEDIELTNGEQDIAEATRCAVTILGETKIIEPTSDDLGGTFGNGLALSTTDPNVANIKVYFEGTDESCTADNINDMDAIGIDVVLGAN